MIVRPDSSSATRMLPSVQLTGTPNCQYIAPVVVRTNAEFGSSPWCSRSSGRPTVSGFAWNRRSSPRPAQREQRSSYSATGHPGDRQRQALCPLALLCDATQCLACGTHIRVLRLVYLPSICSPWTLGLAGQATRSVGVVGASMSRDSAYVLVSSVQWRSHHTW
jgi:hypothetical protein